MRHFLVLGLASSLLGACAATAPPLIPPSPALVPESTTVPTPRPSAPPPTASPTPSATPSLPILQTPTTIVAGLVLDEEGRPIDGARIEVNSLSSGAPYTGSAIAYDGSWVINNIPTGLDVELIASKDGWTTRRRVGAFQINPGQRNEVDFGHPDAGNPGAAYFLSRHTEVTQVTLERSSDVRLHLHLSEPLDDQNRRRFEDAVRVLPANKEAAGGKPLLGDFTRERAPDGFVLDGKDGVIRKNTLSGSKRITAGWNADNTELTLEIPSALLPRRSGARYQVLLASPSGSERIVDKDQSELGLTDAGTWAGPIPLGQLIRAPFLRPDLVISQQPSSGPARWTTTHADAVAIEP